MATPFQERSPCQTASYPRLRRASTGKAPCSALSSWRLTTSGSALDNQARRLSSRLLMLLMLKVATLTKSLSVVHLLCHVAPSCDEGFDTHPASRRTKRPVRPTNRSPAPRVQASVRTQRTTQDKQWDGGPCRSHRPVPAHVSRVREETCGLAIRRSWCLQNPSGRPPAFPWSQDPGDSSVRRAPGSSAGCRACALWPGATFLRRRERGSSCLRLRRRTGMLPPGSAALQGRPGESLVATVR